MNEIPVENLCAWCQLAEEGKRHFCLTDSVCGGFEDPDEHYSEKFDTCDCEGKHYH